MISTRVADSRGNVKVNLKVLETISLDQKYCVENESFDQ